MGELDGRLAVVTGAGLPGGIGIGIASVLASHGALVVLADLHEAQAARQAAALPDAIGVELDVTSDESVERAFAQIAARRGPLDILVNNAGLGAGDDRSGWYRTFEVNLHGVVRCCEASLRTMRERRSGKIVNIASISGHAARGASGSYGASKAAVLRYTKGIAVEEASYSINVNAVCPGAVWSAMQRRSFAEPETIDPSLAGLSPYEAFVAYYGAMTPLGRVQTPEDVGEAVAFLASERASQITGQCLHVDGGAIRAD